MLYVVALAWMYVVLMVALVELFSPQGTAVGALFTVLGWGLIPLSVVLYILATPGRRAARRGARQSRGPAPGRSQASARASPRGRARAASKGSSHHPRIQMAAAMRPVIRSRR